MSRLAVAGLVFGILLSACGGGEEPTREDADTVEALVRSNASVQGAFQSLYSCLPENVGCYTKSGPRALEVAERERQSFSTTLEATDHPCLVEAGRLYLNALNAYADAGRAASDGKPAAFDAAISRSTESEIAYIRKLGACGFQEGQTGQIGAGLRAVNIEILRLSEAYAGCGDEECVFEVSRKLESAADRGIALVEDFLRELPNEAPSCLEPALRAKQRAFRSLRKTAVLLLETKLDQAEREGARTGELDTQAQRLLADCIASTT